MKKVFKLLLVILTGFVFVSTLKANANSTLVEMREGAQIRTKTEELEQGLRFTAKLEEEALGKDHGFYLIYGIPNEDDLESLESFEEGATEINGKEVFKVPVPGVSQGGEFSVVLTGIPKDSVGYLKQITVLAYVVDDGEELSNTMTRSVYQVAKAMLANGENEDLANSIIGAIDFVTDAEIVYDFTDLEGKGSAYTETTLGELLDDGEHFKSVSDLDRVYNGGDSSHFGMLKLGGSSDNGSFILTLQETVLIKTVVLVANGWLENDKIIVNGESYNLTLINNDRLVVELEDETNEIIIESDKRALIYKLELYGEEIVVPATQYVEVTFDYDYEDKDDEVVTIVKGNSVVVLDDPVRGGFTFLGWYLGEAEYNNEALNANTTLVANWEEVIVETYIEDAEIIYDFSGLTKRGILLNETTLQDILDHEYVNSIADVANVYDGNGTGGGFYENATGLIKLGKSKEAGKFTIVLNNDVIIAKVALYVEGWGSNDKLYVNEQEYSLNRVDTYGEFIIVTLIEETNIIEIKIDERGLIFGLELYGPNATVNEPSYYDVTFDYNDGETNAVVENIRSGLKISKPSNPTRDGFTFEGWFEDLSDDNAFDFDTPITGNVSLIAKWKIVAANEPTKYIETFDKVKVTGSSYVAEDDYIDDNGFSWTMKGRPDGILDGKAWMLGNAADNSFVQVVATGGISSFSLDVIRAFTNANARKLELFVNGVSKGTFEVIKDSNTRQNWEVNNINISGNVTIKVVSINKGSRGATIVDNFTWVEYLDGQPPVEYDVTFNSNGGSAVAPMQVAQGEKITKPTDPTKSGFTFGGWYKEVGLTNAWNFANDVVTGNITLYAKWVDEQSGGDSEPVEVVLAYPNGAGTKNMVDGNNATTVGLDASIFTVTSTKRVDSPLHIGLNNAGEIRLYGSSDTSGNILTVTIAQGYEITKIEVNFGGTVGSLLINVDGTEKYSDTPTKNGTLTYSDLSATEFSLQNKNSSTGQIYIKSIKITYSPKA